MPRARKSAVESTPDGGAALERLTPPTQAMLLEADVAKATRKLDRMFKRGAADEYAVTGVLDSLADGAPVMYTRGGGIGATGVLETGSFLEALKGIYVPTEAEPTWLPASQRYMHEQIWTGSVGSASAYKRNGKLTSIQSVNTTVTSESAWAGVYAQFRADPARYGTLSRVTVDPEIYWTGRDIVDVDHRWNANIDGTMWFEYRIWTVVYQFNIANGHWEPLLSNRSALATTVASASWHVVGGGEYGHSGSIRNGEASLAFVVEPTRTYLFGVLTEMRVSHSLRRTDGQSIPQPSLKELNAYGLFKADVPAMYLSHVVLAK
jgi:hypothetical protein